MPNAILQQIVNHKPAHPILSLYLDMSVNSDNKRTYQTFINKQRSRFPALDSDRDAHHRRDAPTGLPPIDLGEDAGVVRVGRRHYPL